MAGDRSKIHVGDVGTEFRFLFRDEQDQIVDLTGFDTLTAVFKSPTGSVSVTLTPVAPTEGSARFVTTVGFIDAAGAWRVQGRVVFLSGAAWRTNIHRFPVYDNLAT